MEYNGTEYRALLDSGCDVSVLGRRILPGVQYTACKKNLLAANALPISILGSTVVAFRVAGVSLEHQFLVSDSMEEIILGSDYWLTTCALEKVETSRPWIRALPSPVYVKLGGSANRQSFRRIYAEGDTHLLPHSQCSVPVKSVWTTLPSCGVNWMVKPKTLKCGALLARTLL
jgi:hypothetical protein